MRMESSSPDVTASDTKKKKKMTVKKWVHSTFTTLEDSVTLKTISAGTGLRSSKVRRLS
jgi:hypothetical protein